MRDMVIALWVLHQSLEIHIRVGTRVTTCIIYFIYIWKEKHERFPSRADDLYSVWAFEQLLNVKLRRMWLEAVLVGYNNFV